MNNKYVVLYFIVRAPYGVSVVLVVPVLIVQTGSRPVLPVVLRLGKSVMDFSLYKICTISMEPKYGILLKLIVENCLNMDVASAKIWIKWQ
jgi:hypothetical protein